LRERELFAAANAQQRTELMASLKTDIAALQGATEHWRTRLPLLGEPRLYEKSEPEI
jgi:hypothetical protein